MDRYFGFDLGDAESAIARIDRDNPDVTEILPVREAKSFITAYALLPDGGILIGESACYAPKAADREIRFKSRFLTDPDSRTAIRRFAAGVLGELYGAGQLIKNEDCSFYIGCPAGWDRSAREDYRAIFEEVGCPPLRIISESRAALVNACRSKYLQVGYDILAKPVLVIDIGSSTTDLAYISAGHEVELKTAGEVVLGGGVMDEILLEEGIRASGRADRIRKVFEESRPWKSYCEFAARRLKEKYFSDEAYFSEHPCTESVQIRAGGLPLKLRLSLDKETAERLVEQKTDHLGGRSFRQVFTESLKDAKEKTGEPGPELIFLTGGVSKMPVIKTWVREIFPDSVVITGTDPEFAVAKGLAFCGQIDEELRAFKADLAELVSSTKVEEVVNSHITELYRAMVDVLVEPVLENAALPVFDRWRSGEIARLKEVDGILENEIRSYLTTSEVREMLIKPVTDWLRPVARDIEAYTVPICVRHNVPYSSLSLSSYLSVSDLAIRVEAKDIFAVEEITWIIDTLVSVLVGLLCGGGGIALVESGAPGIIVGAFLSLVVLVLGKDKMEQALLGIEIPKTVRRLVGKNAFRNRIGKTGEEIRASFYRSLEEEKNEEITGRMAAEISDQIELCLTKMAEVVEVPLA